MYKSPYLALTRIISHKLAQSRHCQVETILITHPTLSVISQLLHKGKTAKNTDFKTLKDNVIGPSHPPGISNSLCGKGISPLHIR